MADLVSKPEAVLMGLSMLIGFIFWMSAIYWKLKTLCAHVRTIANEHGERLDRHEQAIHSHDIRLVKLEGRRE